MTDDEEFHELQSEVKKFEVHAAISLIAGLGLMTWGAYELLGRAGGALLIGGLMFSWGAWTAMTMQDIKNKLNRTKPNRPP